MIVKARKSAMTSKTMKSAAKLKNSNLIGLLAGGKLSPQAYGMSLSFVFGAVGESAFPMRYMTVITITAKINAIANSMKGH
mgnify:CR=1 FL=1